MFVATGEVGRIRVGYRPAAGIRSWRLSCEWPEIGPVRQTVSGMVPIEGFDQFWSTQTPISISLQMGPGCWWTWACARAQGPLEVGAMIEIRVEGHPEVSID